MTSTQSWNLATFHAGTTSDPAQGFYWHIICSKEDVNSTHPTDWNCTVTITYYVRFYGRNLVDPSTA